MFPVQIILILNKTKICVDLKLEQHCTSHFSFSFIEESNNSTAKKTEFYVYFATSIGERNMPSTAVTQPLQMKNVLKEENLKAWPEQETGMKTSLILRRVSFLFIRNQAECQ